ncbi:MAG: OPT/YSL family transporter, partial [Bacteroidetes bacterium]|nr:OPT/YSL family transporter [Bacteroidota bacterium]
MAIKIGINGFGRIGRLVFRRCLELGGFDFVGINDLTDAKTLAHLLKYDSVHGRFNGDIDVEGDDIIVNGDRIKITAEKDPTKLNWGKLGAEVIIESTGVFRTQEDCMKHVEAGAKKVILTVPPKGDVDGMIVLGVNDDVLTGEEKVLSNASCTTNCLAPMVKVLNDAFGFVEGATAREPLLAPQANIMATIVQGVMNSNLPWTPILVGGMIAIGVELLGVSSLPFAIGLYLPLSLSTPIMAGALIAYIVRKVSSDQEYNQRNLQGVLFASGMVAGDALIGVLVAFMIGSWAGYAGYYDSYEGMMNSVTGPYGPWLALILFGGLAVFMYRMSTKG